MSRYYSVDEANSRVPNLEAIFSRVMQMRAQLKLLYKRLEHAGHPPAMDTLELPLPETAMPQAVRDQAVFKAMVETLSDTLREVDALGAEVKDVETGLCDFLARRDGHDILLCWRYGEKSIEYWHDLHTGVAGRRPLTDEDRRKVAVASVMRG